MRSKFVEWSRVSDNLDAVIRDSEIRAFWEGLTYSNQSYNQRINTTKTFFNVSKATIEKCLYNR